LALTVIIFINIIHKVDEGNKISLEKLRVAEFPTLHEDFLIDRYYLIKTGAITQFYYFEEMGKLMDLCIVEMRKDKECLTILTQIYTEFDQVL
jgi:hypothetical protein